MSAAYNEYLDARGEPRPALAAFRRRTGVDAARPAARAARALADAPLGDRIPISPLPLVLPESEYREVLEPGVRQRARALQLFFGDMALGPQAILSPGGPLRRETVEWVFDDEGRGLAEARRLWAGKSLRDARFVYGPDLIRGPEGDWRVTEDNIGRIGGMADTFSMLRRYQAETGATPASTSADDLARAIELYLDELGLSPRDPGVVALLAFDDASDALELGDLENTRRLAVLESLGIETWDLNALDERRRARARDGGVKAFVNFDVRGWTPRKEFRETVFRERGVPLFEAPGVKVVDNKGFLPFVEDMIRFYLGEEPILRTQPTELVREGALPDPRGWVVKKADGLESKQVLLLPRMRASQLRAAERTLAGWLSQPRETDGRPPVVVRQRYVEPSYLPFSPEPASWAGLLVELRPITYVYGDGKIFVGRHLNGRAISSLGDPRNCITRGAFGLPVFLEP